MPDSPLTEFNALMFMCNHQGGPFDTSCGSALSTALRGQYLGEFVGAAIFAGMADAAEMGTAKMAALADELQAARMSQQIGSRMGWCSFTRDTRVLLASGKTAPIAALKPGDKVLATNTTTGKTTRPLRPQRQDPPRASGHPHHRQPPHLEPLPEAVAPRRKAEEGRAPPHRQRHSGGGRWRNHPEAARRPDVGPHGPGRS
jgi:hypothetical protein